MVKLYYELEHFRTLDRLPWSYELVRTFFRARKVPQGWHQTDYGKTGSGSCAVRLSMALKAAGYADFKDFADPVNQNGRHVWPRAFAPGGLPVNAAELAHYVFRRLGRSQQIDITSDENKLRQGIICIGGFNDASGHITLWDGQTKRFEDGTNYPEAKVVTNTHFWDLRPTWLMQR